MGTPLEIKISKIGLRHVLSCPKLGLESNRQNACFISIGRGVGSHPTLFRQYNTITNIKVPILSA